MSTLLVKHLASKGCKEVTVLNRSLPRAEALAAEFPEVRTVTHTLARPWLTMHSYAHACYVIRCSEC